MGSSTRYPPGQNHNLENRMAPVLFTGRETMGFRTATSWLLRRCRTFRTRLLHKAAVEDSCLGEVCSPGHVLREGKAT